MLIDDLIDIVRIDIGVPGTFGVNDKHRPFFAAVEAAGFIDTDSALACEAEFLDAALRMFLRCSRARVITAWAAFVALVQAKEHVLFVLGLVAHVCAHVCIGLALKRK